MQINEMTREFFDLQMDILEGAFPTLKITAKTREAWWLLFHGQKPQDFAQGILMLANQDRAPNAGMLKKAIGEKRNDRGRITDAQIKELRDMLKSLGVHEGEEIAMLYRAHQIECLAHIPSERFNEMKTFLKNNAATRYSIIDKPMHKWLEQNDPEYAKLCRAAPGSDVEPGWGD
jgi:hypothetical protein